MAAQVGKWEVVGKGNKKRANNDKKKDKTKVNDVPTIDVASKYFKVLKNRLSEAWFIFKFVTDSGLCCRDT